MPPDANPAIDADLDNSETLRQAGHVRVTVESEGVIGQVADPLAGRPGTLDELLADLDDGELRQFLDYWEARRDLRDAQGNGQGSWWAAKHIAAGERETGRRSFLSGRPFTRTGVPDTRP